MQNIKVPCVLSLTTVVVTREMEKEVCVCVRECVCLCVCVYTQKLCAKCFPLACLPLNTKENINSK